MSEATEQSAAATAPGTAIATAPAPPKFPALITTSDVAIWDSASFAHLGRVGALMADSGLCSETLLTEDEYDNNGKVIGKMPAPRAVQVARMVMIANMAKANDADPLMFLQCCSRIGRKIHLEGKAVAAIVRQRTGVALRYELGLWETDHFEPVADRTQLNGAGERLAIRAYDPSDPEREVSGSVGMWKTTRTGSPWSNPGNWPRQLRYRAAPEWARAYEPGAVLGIYSDADEDLDGFEAAESAPRTRQKRDLGGKLRDSVQTEAGAADTGFDRNHVASELGEDTVADAGDDSVAGGDAADEVQGGDAPEVVHDAEFEDAGGDAGGSTIERQKDEASGRDISLGHAEPGEVYLMAGDKPAKKDGRRLTYKDGARFSSLTEARSLDAHIYAEHAPEAVVAEAVDETADETDGLDAACDACGAAAGEECAADCPSAAEAAEAEETAAGTDEPETTEEPATEKPAGFLATLRPLTKWTKADANDTDPTIKAAWVAFMKTEDYTGADPDLQEELRAAVWPEVLRVRELGAKGTDPAADATAFSLWMATQKGADGAEQISATFDLLKKTALSDAVKEALTGRVAARLAAIKAGG